MTKTYKNAVYIFFGWNNSNWAAEIWRDGMKHDEDIHDMLAKEDIHDNMMVSFYYFTNASKEREALEYLQVVFLLHLNQLGHGW